jgi:hypothetical protein
MQKCLNCNSEISCSCKRRHASDGKLVCVNCIADYEKTILELKKTKTDTKNVLPSTTTSPGVS